MDDFLAEITKTFPKMMIHRGDKLKYLGMVFDFDRVAKTVTINCDQFVEELLKDYPYQGRAATPATEDLFKTKEADLLCPKKAKDFHSAVAKLLYLAKRVRGDILTAVSYLTTRVRAPTEDDQEKLERIIKYLRNTAV